MSGAPFALTVTPQGTRLPAGQLHATEHVTVRNSGTAPLTIRTSTITVSQAGKGCSPGQSNGWLSASPEVLSLQAGQSKTVTVTVNAPQTATGSTDLAAVFTSDGSAAGSGSHVTTDGAVGSQFLVTATGAAASAPACGHPVAVPPSSVGGLNTGLLVLLGVVVAATVAAMVGAVRNWRRRHRRTASHAA